MKPSKQARKTMPEPFKIKSIEPIRLISPKKRREKLVAAGYNLFKILAEDVYIDLLTDSGTSAMSAKQWGAIMEGDESYAGCKSFEKLKSTIKSLLGFKYILPTHQGRPAENILMSVLVKRGTYVLGNTHFDSTMAHIHHKGGIGVNLVINEWKDANSCYPFKGNVDLNKLESFIKAKGTKNISFFLMTVTNNAGGGQPVSMENIKKTREITSKYNIPFYMDIARFAENAYFIKTREAGFSKKTIVKIVKEMMKYSDGAVMSAKKDGLVNMGGFIALNDEKIYQDSCKLLILFEGFITYGGMSGRDIEALNQGLKEVVEESYLRYRIGQIEYLGNKLDEASVPLIKPFGGHAIYIDAGAFLPHIPPKNFPGHALAVELYLQSGIRAAEIGSLALSRRDPKTKKVTYPEMELLRLAIPRRVYTNSHLDYVADAIIEIFKNRKKIKGFKIIENESNPLRHFIAKLAPANG